MNIKINNMLSKGKLLESQRHIEGHLGQKGTWIMSGNSCPVLIAPSGDAFSYTPSFHVGSDPDGLLSTSSSMQVVLGIYRIRVGVGRPVCSNDFGG